MATDCTLQLKLDAAWRRSLRRRLLVWYDRNERDLPWRESSDAYRIWVSEVMLQQTQVATVRPYFKRFVAAFPDVTSLATADERQVLQLWEGLGYYRRARQLHAAAKMLVSEFDGQFPCDVDQLQRLPGVGRYTAGAIASIAFDQRVPILEANTVRLLSRLIGYRDDTTKSAGQKLLWHTAAAILPRKDIARFNQALMELGSLVCTPVEPRCDVCPVSSQCTARAENAVGQIPATKPKSGYIVLREAAVVVGKHGHVLLRRCADGERWAGLWDFPRFAQDAEGPLFAQRELAQKVRELTGVSIEAGPVLQTIKHGVTRYRITLDCYRANYVGGRVRSTKAKPVRWVPPRDLSEYPLSTTGRKIAKLVGAGKDTS